ncbi:class I SAM-dependent methyltransferase [Nonomuraea sp. G32]|nr:class I SAM-dependent methyltransferase [Nonomuraea sp. G32]MDP4510651.1 class I SAM-dependent methyltransferase [Nonomuraea sp. G32]
MGPQDWTPERVTAFWDYWHQQDNACSSYFSEQVGRGVVAYLRKCGVLRGDVLDYGCGNGALSAQLVREGVECWGCDGSAASIKVTNDTLAGKHGWQGAGLVNDPRAPHRTRQFDLVTCLETIEHVTEQEEGKLFADLWQTTKPGGIAFFTTPNEEDLTSADVNVYCPFCGASYHRMQHVRRFDADSLAVTIEKYGFRVSRVEAVNFSRHQIPAWPGIWNVNARYFAGMVAGARFGPGRILYRRLGGRKPHLCAFAIKE